MIDKKGAVCYMHSVKKVLSLFSVLVLAASCQRNPLDRNNSRFNAYNQTGINASLPQNAKLGAVIMDKASCQNRPNRNIQQQGYSGERTETDQEGNEGFSGERKDPKANQQTYGRAGFSVSSEGVIQLIKVSPYVSAYVNPNSRVNTIGRASLHGQAKVIAGTRSTGDLVSRLEFNSDGSALIVSMPDSTGITVIPVNRSGGMGQPYPIGSSHGTHAVTSKLTPHGQLTVAALNNGHLQVYQGNLVNAFGTGVLQTSLRPSIDLVQNSSGEMPLDIKFSPNGELLYVLLQENYQSNLGTNSVSRLPTSLLICDVGVAFFDKQNPIDSMIGRMENRYRGCGSIGFNSGGMYPRGSMQLPDYANRIASNIFGVAVSGDVTTWSVKAPYWGQSGSYYDELFQYMGSARAVSLAANPGTLNLRNQYRDIAIHPVGDEILTLSQNTVSSWDMQTLYGVGNVLTSQDFSGELVDMDVDPGALILEASSPLRGMHDPNYSSVALLANKASYKVHLLSLSGQGFAYSSYTDDIDTPCAPFGVAVRPSVISPIVQNAPKQPPTSQNQPQTAPSTNSSLQ